MDVAEDMGLVRHKSSMHYTQSVEFFLLDLLFEDNYNVFTTTICSIACMYVYVVCLHAHADLKKYSSTV